MKKIYLFLILLLSATIIAQTKNDYEVIQKVKNGVVTFERVPTKNALKKSLGKTNLNSPSSTTTIEYLPEESFETWIPTNWYIYVGGSSEWEQDNGQSNSGTSSAYSSGEPYADTWLITPLIDLTSASDAYLSYYELFEPVDENNDEHNVFISIDYTNNGNPYSATWEQLYGGVDEISTWDFKQLDLQDYLGETVYIAFQYYGNDDGSGNPPYGFDWYIDDVSVTDDGSSSGGCTGNEIEPDCATIVSPPNGATKLQKDVSVFWNPPTSGDFTKQLLYVGTDGGGTTTPTNVRNGTEYSATVIGVTIPNFTPNTTYYWKIVPANCTNEAQNCPISSFTIGDGNTNYGGGGPTQGGYAFANSISGTSSQPTYNWIDISGTGTDLINSIGDDATKGPYSIGFTFPFIGNAYSQFYINSNGFIAFENTTGQTNFPFPIPANRKPDDLIAGYWWNLNPTNPNILGKHLYYGLNNGDLVVTYEKYPEKIWNGSMYVPADANGWITFQIILSPNGNVKVQVKDKGTSFAGSGGIGIENVDGTKGILYRRFSFGGPILDGSSPLAIEFTPNGVSPSVSAEIKIFLEGPYSSPTMNNSLGASIPIVHPYATLPWSYTGIESVSGSFLTNNNIVDWVLVELRTGSSAATATTVVSRRAALVRNDGVILDVDGSVDIDFPGISAGNYYIAVYHRNHLAVISAVSVGLN